MSVGASPACLRGRFRPSSPPAPRPSRKKKARSHARLPPASNDDDALGRRLSRHRPHPRGRLSLVAKGHPPHNDRPQRRHGATLCLGLHRQHGSRSPAHPLRAGDRAGPHGQLQGPGGAQGQHRHRAQRCFPAGERAVAGHPAPRRCCNRAAAGFADRERRATLRQNRRHSHRPGSKRQFARAGFDPQLFQRFARGGEAHFREPGPNWLSLRERRAAAVLAVGPIGPGEVVDAVAAVAKATRGTPSILSLDEGEAIAKRNPGFEEIDIPKGAFKGNPPIPDDDAKGVAVSYRFVVPTTMLNAVAGALARSILKTKAKLWR